jgi:PIN domain nuclease of toxin-antitoxin system
MNNVVLDASALLAVLNQETGYETVEPLLSSAHMSTVNIAEVISVLASDGVPIKQAKNIVSDLIRHVIAFDIEQAHITAELKSQTKSHGLSLGDRACLALASQLKTHAVTADKAWGKLDIDVPIKLIR